MTRLIAIALLTFLPSLAFAENWPSWRGPGQNGVAVGKGYPTEWSATENVAWKIKLPGRGASTPAVWEDKIFLTCGVEKYNTLLCYDRSGKELWKRSLGKERAGKNQKASGSNSSAVTDGQHVFVYFKSGDLACVDLSGNVIWQQNLQEKYGEDTLWWDLGTSPVLSQKHVIVACMHSGPSYVAAFDKMTGDVAWKQARNLKAPSEAAQSYTTPVLLSEGDKETLVVLGADHVTAHDAATGKELWRVGGLNPKANGFFRSISSAVVSDGLVVAPYARGSTITAIRLGGSGNVTDSHVAWTKDGLGADVPTPVATDGKAYVCTDRGDVVCLDLKTGDKLWSGNPAKSNKNYSSSPVLADGKIYIVREDGAAFVLAQGDEFKVLASNQLEGEFVVASPVFVDGQILIRTFDHLYCIGEKK